MATIIQCSWEWTGYASKVTQKKWRKIEIKQRGKRNFDEVLGTKLAALAVSLWLQVKNA